MAAIPLIQPEAATGELAELFAETQQALGVTPNLAKALANSPAAMRGCLELATALRAGTLPAPMCERVALLVAQENECDYGLSWHTYMATKRAGLTEAEAARARRGEADDPAAAAALDLAAALIRERGDVSHDQLAAARDAGLSPGQLVEIVAHVALNVLANYLAKAARVDNDWPLVRHTEVTEATEVKDPRKEPTMTEGVKTIMFPVTDVAKAKALFGPLAGVQPYMDEAYYVGFNIGGQDIGLDLGGHRKGMSGPVAYWHVEDIEASLQALLDAGAVPDRKVRDVGGGKLIATVKDTDGNVIGLLQPGPNGKE